MIAKLHQVIKDMENGIYDFTKDGECSGCGSCCSNLLPISRKEVKEIHRYMKKHNIKAYKNNPPTVKPIEIDMTCPFLDGSKDCEKCMIYIVRPMICRDFKCDNPRKKIYANKSRYHRRYEVVDMRKEFYGEQEIERKRGF